MIQFNNVEILCGSLAAEAARETVFGGIFTDQLLHVLAQLHDPSLLALPFSLAEWHRALPENLLQSHVEILDQRQVLGEEEPPPSPRQTSQGVAAD